MRRFAIKSLFRCKEKNLCCFRGIYKANYMKYTQPISAGALATKLGAQLIGDAGLQITGMNEIHKVTTGDLTFVDVEKYYKKVFDSAASAIIMPEIYNGLQPDRVVFIHPRPFEAYNQLAKEMQPAPEICSAIDPKAKIARTAKIAPNAVIAPFAEIGENTIIGAGVFVGAYTKIGANCSIMPNTVIGGDAFYFHKEGSEYKPWHTIGRVIIEDDVHIGSSCTIDRGVSGDTIIGQGSKLDSQIHIGHGVVLGKNCLLAAQVGIAGKTILGDSVVLYGQVGVSKGLHIGDRAVVFAKSGVRKSLEGDKAYFGYPAEVASVAYRELAALRQLPQMIQRENAETPHKL